MALGGFRLLVSVGMACAILGGEAIAQAPARTTAMPGFASKNRGQPVHIEAATLEVRDKDRMATFSGNVQVVQGDTTMRCKVLVVHYEPNQPGSPKTTASGGGSQQISRLEAKGGVVVTQQEQTATGDTGLFDMKTNKITLLGNVTVSQGGNVVRGERLVVDMTTGVSTVDAGESKGPVRMLLEQNKDGTPMKQMKTPALPTSRN